VPLIGQESKQVDDIEAKPSDPLQTNMLATEVRPERLDDIIQSCHVDTGAFDL
jgi:hypothetical protein